MATTVLSQTKRSGASTIVGLLACQADSYRQNMKTSVVSCVKAPKGHYEVEFKDTVLFPEGGGQPNDTGLVRIGDREVLVRDVQRDGLTAVHVVDEEVPVGAEVEMVVNWRRRWDHMQQHTGQHLLSAVLDKRDTPTLSWNMGSRFNYVELPRRLSPEEQADVQREINDYIRAGIPIHVEQHRENKDAVDHEVPSDYDLDKGVIRVIHIGELDANPCCGTHLQTTKDIGSCILLHSQTIRGTNCRLFFMCGDRVTDYATEAHSMLRRAGAALSCQTEDIEDKIQRLAAQSRDNAARERFWAAQVAARDAADIRRKLDAEKFAFLHRAEASADFVKTVEKELGKLKPGDGTLVLVTGEGKQGGSIVISGDNVDSYAAKVKDAVKNVKGGGKGKWQGKVVSYEKGELEALKALADLTI